METLTILYDARCELCRRVRAWLEAQPSYIQLEFVAAGSAEARRRYPDLDHAATLQDLTVVSDSGDVYGGAHGWLICLWALHDYRAWSLTLSTPALMPQAQRFITWVARNRWRLGRADAEVCLVDGPAGASCQIADTDIRYQ
jgi:predicted DCC family thiol-disulfide oxidoreductase YuxK